MVELKSSITNQGKTERMESIYLIESGCYLKKDGECLKIMKDRQTIQTIPATGLEQLTLAGRTSLTGPVLDFLINHKVDTVFMSPDGRFRARLLLDDSGHVRLRQKQYRRLGETAAKLAFARNIVASKLENQARLLLRRGSQYNNEELRKIAIQIKALKKRIPETDDMDILRGIEGSGAKLFFSSFSLLILNSDFFFHGRNRRPPRDPVNALLSFVYTLFTNEVLNAIRVSGLDPYLGALHEVASGRPSLACDLVEEWRVFAERLVLGLINKKIVKPHDFIFRKKKEQAGGLRPVEMKPAVYRALIKTWRRQLDLRLHYPPTGLETSIRWIIHGQSRRMVEWLKDERENYEPFLMNR